MLSKYGEKLEVWKVEVLVVFENLQPFQDVSDIRAPKEKNIG
jgi:hypothetical protein